MKKPFKNEHNEYGEKILYTFKYVLAPPHNCQFWVGGLLMQVDLRTGQWQAIISILLVKVSGGLVSKSMSTIPRLTLNYSTLR
jgi:hypothetical protein